MRNAIEIEFGGERLLLLPERAVWWPERSTLFIADTHFGKTATFRGHGVPVGDGPLIDDLQRLSCVIEGTGTRRLTILGDLIHARIGRSTETMGLVADWRKRRPDLDVCLVLGNHDRAAGRPSEEWRFQVLPEGVQEPPFTLLHDPRRHQSGPSLAGHLHPKIHARGLAGPKFRLPCFWQQDQVLILPAFGSFIDSAAVSPDEGDRVFVIADEAVHPWLVTPSRSRRRRVGG